MWEDPIVAEVHRIREEIAARFNYDVKAYLDDVRRRQAALGSRLVTRRKPPETNGTPGQSSADPARPGTSASDAGDRS